MQRMSSRKRKVVKPDLCINIACWLPETHDKLSTRIYTAKCHYNTELKSKIKDPCCTYWTKMWKEKCRTITSNVVIAFWLQHGKTPFSRKWLNKNKFYFFFSIIKSYISKIQENHSPIHLKNEKKDSAPMKGPWNGKPTKAFDCLHKMK